MRYHHHVPPPRAKTKPTFGPALRASLRPIAAYWLFLVAMFGAFSVAAFLTDPQGSTVGALVLIGGTTVAGVFVGQILALLRIRSWLVFAFAIVWWTLGALFSASLTAAAGPLGAVAAVIVVLFPFFLSGGLWSLHTGRALFAAWVPLIYASGAAILMAESQGKVATWKAGQKYAVWDVYTFGVLVMGIVLLLGFLVAREGHRLALWRVSPHGPLAGSVAESGSARPRLSLLGWALLCLFAFGVALGSAALAPYLWRTGPADHGEQTDNGANTKGDQAKNQSKKPSRDPQKRPAKKSSSQRKVGEHEHGPWVGVREDLRPAKQGPGGVVLNPWMLFALLVIGLVLGGPPLRRLGLVEWLRHPRWRRSATARVEAGWSLVELALEDAGVPARAGEPAARHIARAAPELAALLPIPVASLAEVAEIRDRVAYGLGVDPRDVARMDEVAGLVFDTVWDRLGDRAQIRALYRIF